MTDSARYGNFSAEAVLSRSIFVIFLAVGFCAVLAQTPTATIRVPVRLVTVPTLVFSNDNGLVTGLEANNFRIFDNGHLQRPSLDVMSSPLSVAIAIQTNQDVREYLPFIVKAGNVFESLLMGESGEAAVITYADEVSTVKAFGQGDLSSAFRRILAGGRNAHMLDAVSRGLMLLREREASRARLLLVIGQPADTGSETALPSVKEVADRNNVTVFTITLPEYGKAFVSDNFTLEGPASTAERGGFKAGVNLGKLISVLNHSGEAATGTDPFSVLASATGGAQFHVRRQKEFEDAISAVGFEVRSVYQLSFSPTSSEAGYHTIRVEVDVPNARVLSRPGYWRTSE
jgi:VWFA-related protein